MKWLLPVTIVILALYAMGDVTAQGNLTPPCRARTLDLRAQAFYDFYDRLIGRWRLE